MAAYEPKYYQLCTLFFHVVTKQNLDVAQQKYLYAFLACEFAGLLRQYLPVFLLDETKRGAIDEFFVHHARCADGAHSKPALDVKAPYNYIHYTGKNMLSNDELQVNVSVPYVLLTLERALYEKHKQHIPQVHVIDQVDEKTLPESCLFLEDAFGIEGLREITDPLNTDILSSAARYLLKEENYIPELLKPDALQLYSVYVPMTSWYKYTSLLSVVASFSVIGIMSSADKWLTQLIKNQNETRKLNDDE